MGKVTFVVEFEDGLEPPVHAHMDVLGGKLVSVAWRDVIEQAELDNNEREYHFERCRSCTEGARGGCGNCAYLKK